MKHNQAQAIIDQVERDADLGYDLHGEWEGCRAIHCLDDQYRIIWEDLEPEVDYTGAEGDLVVPVAILRVERKKTRGGTVYTGGRPKA